MAKSEKPPFADRLRELRLKAGLTQARLADLAGLHISAVTRFEQGWREPSLSTAGALAAALGVKVDDLLAPPTQPGIARQPRGRPPAKAGQTPPAAVPSTPPGEDLEAEGEQPHSGKALGRAKRPAGEGKAKRPGRARKEN
jgi:transcriptional regulator with XRE-family HTH domain